MLKWLSVHIWGYSHIHVILFDKKNNLEKLFLIHVKAYVFMNKSKINSSERFAQAKTKYMLYMMIIRNYTIIWVNQRRIQGEKN